LSSLPWEKNVSSACNIDPARGTGRDDVARIEQAVAAGGEVLRVQVGFNPNSSSVGSVVQILLWSATVGTIAWQVAGALLRKPADEANPPAPGSEP
jgi:hypothetical protein